MNTVDVFGSLPSTQLFYNILIRGETIQVNAVLRLSVLQYIAILQYLIGF